MGHSLVRSLIRSHRSLVCLLCTTCFACALPSTALTRSLAHSLIPELVGQRMIGRLFLPCFFLFYTIGGLSRSQQMGPLVGNVTWTPACLSYLYRQLYLNTSHLRNSVKSYPYQSCLSGAATTQHVRIRHSKLDLEGLNRREKEGRGGRIKLHNNKAGYTAQDAPSMRTFHLRKYRGTDGRTDSYRDATAHLKEVKICKADFFRSLDLQSSTVFR